ncbi:MAG: hypothetical protein AAF376_11015 [Pseudomonadota bacterium]
MSRSFNPVAKIVSEFVKRDNGVATVDWVVVCSACTALGLATYNITHDTYSTFSEGIREEIQTPVGFDAWADNMVISPEEIWGETATDLAGQVGTPPSAPPPPSPPLDITPPPSQDDGGTTTGGGTGTGGGTTGGGGTGTGGGTTGGGTTGGGTGTGGGPVAGGGTTGGGNTGGGSGSNPTVTPGPIDLVNNSFESISLANYETDDSIPGWDQTGIGFGGSATWNPANDEMNTGGVTGRNTAIIMDIGYPGTLTMISQTTGTRYSADGVYEFSVDIGDTYFPDSDNEPFIVNVMAGNTVIGTYDGITGDNGRMETITVTSDIVDASLNGQPIGLEVRMPTQGDGAISLIAVDNVRGTVSARAAGITDAQGRLVPDSPVAGCPNNTDFGGTPYTQTGTQLTSTELEFNVTIGAAASTDVSSCGVTGAYGNFTANPTFSLNLSDMENLGELEIETEDATGQCDPVLLVRDETGEWFFDDTTGDHGTDAKVKFRDNNFDMSRLNGVVDVWVGSRNGQECSVIVETGTQN